jgi:hypothetical protein
VVDARTVTEPLNPANTEEPDRFTLPEVPVGVRSGLERIGDGAEVLQYYPHVHGSLNAMAARLPTTIFAKHSTT